MEQTRFELLLTLLEENNQKDILFTECYIKSKNDKVLVHDMGIFDTKNVINIFRDKMSMQQLKIQKHNLIGMDTFFKNLVTYSETQVTQFLIATSDSGYLIVLSSNETRIIGILKYPKLNIKNDMEQQQELKRMEHENHNLFLFDKGVFAGSL